VLIGRRIPSCCQKPIVEHPAAFQGMQTRVTADAIYLSKY
jgi:hypothetical protein